MTIRFGTDGWRAVISDTFTFANLQLVAQAIADYVLDQANTCPIVTRRKWHVCWLATASPRG
jgi:phosphomannomutase